MKKIFAFLSILLLVMILGYAQPVVMKKNFEKPTAHQINDGQSVYNSLPYKKIETTGFALFIGKNINDIIDEFGEPSSILATSADYDWYQFWEENNYFQVAVKEETIIEILVLGVDIEQAKPFQSGMKIKDISNQMVLYTNFNLDFDNETYEFELSEKDISTLPLIAFSNGSFVMCHISPVTHEVVALRYVDTSILLQLMPYRLTTGNNVPFIPDESIDWEKVNKANSDQAQLLFSVLSNKQNNLKFNQKLSDASNIFLNTLLLSPSDIFTDESRLQLWNSNRLVMSISQPFNLNKTELKRLFSVSHFTSSKEANGYVVSPSPDISWVMLNMLRKKNYMFDPSSSKNYIYGFHTNQDIFVLIELQKKSKFSFFEGESSSQ